MEFLLSDLFSDEIVEPPVGISDQEAEGVYLPVHAATGGSTIP